MSLPRTKGSTTLDLEEHSQAKVEFIQRYLAIYLNILENVPFINEVHVLDLMCGEDTYENGRHGTAVEITKTVVEHHRFFKEVTRNRLVVWLNDNGQSLIEPSRSKVERVQSICAPMVQHLPRNIEFRYRREDALDLARSVLHQTQSGRGTHVLFVIDPYGYKEVRPSIWKELLGRSGVEVIQFLPISFMSRFAERALEDPYPGSEPLTQHLQELWGAEPANVSSARDFLRQYVARLQFVLGNDFYLADIALETNKGNTFALIFITRNLRGLEVMINAKWKYDTESGEGHRRNMDQMSLFQPHQDQFEVALLEYIKASPSGRTNLDVACFTLKQGFPVSRAANILKPRWRSGNVTVHDPTQEGGRAKGLYLTSSSKPSSRDKKTVMIKVVSR